MRRDTKLAIVIGLIVVGFGSWYITLPEVSERSDTEALPADNAQDKPDMTLAKSAESDKLADTALPGESFQSRPKDGSSSPIAAPQPDQTGSADRLPVRQPVGIDTVKVDSQRSVKLALPSSLGQTTSQPAGVPYAKSVTTQPAVATGKAELAKRIAPQKPKEPYKWHVVQAGDNYSKLAEQYLGSAKHYPLLAKANPGIQPRRLKIGAKIKIPNLPTQPVIAPSKSPTGSSVSASPVHRLMAEPLPSIPEDRAYMIKEGEGWTSLAERYLGTSSRWPELYELNRERVPHNPNNLPEGTMIELPKPVKSD